MRIYILFNHSSINGHLGYFHFGAVMNNAAANICGQVFVAHVLSFPMDRYLRVVLLSHIYAKHFKKLPAAFQSNHTILLPTNSV